MKMFVNFKNSSMFAVSYINARGGNTASNDSGFFISDCQHTGYNTPLLMLNGSTAPCECRTKGKVIAFFYFQIFKHFYSVMSYTESNVTTTKISNCANTPNSATTISIEIIQEFSELKKRIAVEKNCKNEAYAFILAMGLLEEFKTFSQETAHIEDKHTLALSFLMQ